MSAASSAAELSSDDKKSERVRERGEERRALVIM
jgi:hypothetical protein